MALVDNFDPRDENMEYSPLGNNYGNPMINLLMKSLAGFNYNPKPADGQSMYDAHIQRQRSMHFMNLQRSGLANNMLFSRMGIGGSSTANAIGGLMGSPEGLLGKTMSPFLGGNPMTASMQLYAGLSGATSMGSFGRYGAITEGETQRTMEKLSNNFYSTQKYNGPEGVQEKIQKDFVNTIMEGADTEKGLDYLKNVGLDKTLRIDQLKKQYGTSGSGGLTQEGKDELRKRADSIKTRFTDEGDIGKALDNALQENKQQSNETINLVNAVKEAQKKGDEKVIKKTTKNLRDKLEKTYGVATDQLDSKLETLGLTKQKDTLTKIGEGFSEVLGGEKSLPELDLDKIQESAEAAKSPNRLQQLRQQDKAAKEAGFVYTGFNFEKSRGFKLEDITSGFAKAADLRMLGDRRNTSVDKAMSDFSTHGMGAMSAARSVFGNRSGSELISKMSDLAGASNVDLGSEKGASEMEQLLRKTNATARVAGISIKTMLAIIDSSRQLASNNPALQNMNAGAHTEIAMKAVGTAARMGANMSGAEFRAAGGSQGIASKEIESGQVFAGSDMGKAQQALLYKAKSISPEKYKQVQDMISRGEVTADSLTNKGKMKELADTLGMSVQDLNMQVLQNPLYADKASKDADISSFTQTTGMNATVVAEMKDVFKGMNIDLDEEFTKSGNNVEALENLLIEKSAGNTAMQSSLKQYMPQIKTHYIDKRNPGRKEEFEKNVKEQQEMETKMSKELDSRHAAFGTQLADAVMKGSTISDIGGNVSKLFAVSGRAEQDEKAKAALEGARGLSADLYKRISGADGKKLKNEDIEKLTTTEGKSLLVETLNKQITAGREQARVMGDSDSQELLQNINLPEGLSPEQSGKMIRDHLQTMSESDYENADAAKKDLAELTAKYKAGEGLSDAEKKQKGLDFTENQEKRLSALTTLQATLASDKGFEQLKKGGYSDRALISSIGFGQEERSVNQVLGERKAEYRKIAEQNITDAINALPENSEERKLMSAAMSSPDSGSGGLTDSLIENFKNTKGSFAGLAATPEGQKKLQILQESSFGREIANMERYMEEAKNKYTDQGGAVGVAPAPGGGNFGDISGLKSTIDTLINAISGGDLTKGIQGISAALTAVMNNSPLPAVGN